jgi:hypothetical protein
LKNKLKKCNKNTFNLQEKIEFFYDKHFQNQFSDERKIVDFNNYFEDYRQKIKQILNHVSIENNSNIVNQLDYAIFICNKNKEEEYVQKS